MRGHGHARQRNSGLRTSQTPKSLADKAGEPCAIRGLAWQRPHWQLTISTVIVDEPDDSVHIDEKTGAVETTLPDGDVVVQLNPPASANDDNPDIKRFYENLVEKIEAGKLGVICDDLMEQVQADDNSRKQTLDTRAQGARVARAATGTAKIRRR